MLEDAAAGRRRWPEAWSGAEGLAGGGESRVEGGSWCVGEGCDWEVPRGLPRKNEPRMDWRAEGEGSPRVRGSIDGRVGERVLLSST